jgi:hypothetical protein
MMQRFVRCSLVVTAVVAGACSATQEEVSDLAPGMQNEITLDVENYNFNDVTLYATTVGIRERVGRVPGSGRETFTFRWPRQSLQMQIVFLSGGRVVTETMPVMPGDRLELVIEQAAGDRAILRRGR